MHAWPYSAPCWSPTIAATGTRPPNSEVSPSTSALRTGSGSEPIGMPSVSQSSGSHRSSRMLNNNVREALE